MQWYFCGFLSFSSYLIYWLLFFCLTTTSLRLILHWDPLDFPFFAESDFKNPLFLVFYSHVPNSRITNHKLPQCWYHFPPCKLWTNLTFPSFLYVKAHQKHLNSWNIWSYSCSFLPAIPSLSSLAIF
jgi:hypothetical protein